MYIYDNISVFPAKFVTKFNSKYDYSILENSNEFVCGCNSNELITISTFDNCVFFWFCNR